MRVNIRGDSVNGRFYLLLIFYFYSTPVNSEQIQAERVCREDSQCLSFSFSGLPILMPQPIAILLSLLHTTQFKTITSRNVLAREKLNLSEPGIYLPNSRILS